MGHPRTIFVTSLYDMPRYVRELEPARLVSIIQTELQPPRPTRLPEAAHHRVGVHDITEYQEHGILAQEWDVQRLIDFIHAWVPDDGALLTHCYAGVSRSTATALIACYLKTGDAKASARALRSAAPHAIPNRHIIALADKVLGCDGEMIEARESMGPATVSVLDGAFTTLHL